MRLALVFAGICCALFSSAQITAVNTIIGDESFVKTFGRAPGAGDDDWLRIHTHLAYTEKILRARERHDLSPELQAKRLHLLDLLDDYVANGKFPANADHPEERRPCFIDARGTICAVGYLVEQTEGRDKAESINNHFQYATIYEMHSEWLNGWLQRWGLSAEEAATIQPTYWDDEHRRPHHHRPAPKPKPVRPPKPARPDKIITGNFYPSADAYSKLFYPLTVLYFSKTDSVDLSYTVTAKGAIKNVKIDGGNEDMGKKLGNALSHRTVTPRIKKSWWRDHYKYVSMRHHIRVVSVPGRSNPELWPQIDAGIADTTKRSAATASGKDTLYFNIANGSYVGDSCDAKFVGVDGSVLLDSTLKTNRQHKLVLTHPNTDQFCVYFSAPNGKVLRTGYSYFYPKSIYYYTLRQTETPVSSDKKRTRRRYVVGNN